MPQENGSHYGCNWVTISGNKKALKVRSEQDFSFNVSEYTVEELLSKKHNYELVKSDAAHLYIDYKQHGIGSESCCTTLSDKYCFNDREFDFFFEIKLEDNYEKV